MFETEVIFECMGTTRQGDAAEKSIDSAEVTAIIRVTTSDDDDAEIEFFLVREKVGELPSFAFIVTVTQFPSRPFVRHSHRESLPLFRKISSSRQSGSE